MSASLNFGGEPVSEEEGQISGGGPNVWTPVVVRPIGMKINRVVRNPSRTDGRTDAVQCLTWPPTETVATR